jgi:surface antigen
VPQVGDIISFRGSEKNKEAYGHAAIVTNVFGDQVTIAEQWKGSGTVIETTFTITGEKASSTSSSYYDIYGVARPK